MAIDRQDPLKDFALLTAEEDRRAREALRCYRPSPQQHMFHESQASECVMRGGKRSGKSTAVAAEFASRVLGIPITGADNRPIPQRHPVSKPNDRLLYWVIGWDVDHLGQTIYRLLFQPGLFRVIRDKATGQWRTYNPANPFDDARYSESVPAEPLIPERFIDTTQGVNGWVWENAGAKNFSCCYLKNGAIIAAYPSSGKHAKMGDAVSGIWIDEDIQIPDHLKEWQDRLTDRDGWLLWSVWPHTKNGALIHILDRAEEQVGEEHPNVQSFQLIMSENPFHKEEAKQRALSRMESEDEIARRDRGELLLDTLSMYDFYPGLHTVKQHIQGEVLPDPSDARSLLRRMLTDHGQFPRTWTRYLAIDPSHTRTAVLFAVVPPPSIDKVYMGDLVIVERELIARKYTATMLATEIAKYIEGLNYEAFIMDQQIGRQTRVGDNITVFQAYSDAFAGKHIKARLSGSTFIAGCNQPAMRYRAVRALLEVGRSGMPRMLFLDQATPETQHEFHTYRKKSMYVKGEETIFDEPANPRKHDAMAALEYLCAYIEECFTVGTAYVEPETYGARGSAAYRKAMSLLQKHREKHGSYVHLGPGAAA